MSLSFYSIPFYLIINLFNICPNFVQPPSQFCPTFITVPSNIYRNFIRCSSQFCPMFVNAHLFNSVHVAPSIQKRLYVEKRLSVVVHPHQHAIFFQPYVLQTYLSNTIFFKPYVRILQDHIQIFLIINTYIYVLHTFMYFILIRICMLFLYEYIHLHNLINT